MKIYLFIFILGFIGTREVYAQAEIVSYTPRILTGYYFAHEGESLDFVLKNEVGLKPDLSKARVEKIAQYIKGLNRYTKNWNQFKENQRIYLEIPYDSVTADSFLRKRTIVTKEKMATNREVEETKIEKVTKVVEKQEEKTEPSAELEPENHYVRRYSLVYSTSIGKFKEKREETQSEVSSTQYSPITLGGAISISNPSSSWSYSGSIYFSYMRPQNLPSYQNIQTDVSLPPEIGVTAYAQKMLSPQFFSLYGGADLERFSTLNLIELENQQTNVLSYHQHTVLYGTLGANFYLHIKEQPFNLRFSYSHSVVSKVNVSNLKSYTGYKAILYFQVPLNEHFFLNSFYKHHQMSGASDLTVNRIGLGIGYIF